jgi:hypothetical protein
MIILVLTVLQGNAILTDIGRIPDTEDLNRNGNLDQDDIYFRYEIPLDTNATRNEVCCRRWIKS